MSSSNPNSLPKLLIFPEDCQLAGLSNWAVFRDHLKSVARSTGLGGYLDGSISPPPIPALPALGTAIVIPASTQINSRNPSPEEWELRDNRLAGIVYQNIKDPRSIGVTQDMTSNNMWRKLVAEYETTSAAAQTLVKEHIQQYKYQSGTPFEEYFKTLESLRKGASDVGCTIGDNDLKSRFLTSLSSDYLWVLQTHGARPYPELKRVLIEYDMMLESTAGVPNGTNIPNVMVINGRSGGIICDNCKRAGHTVKNCWAKGGGSEGKAPRWYNAPKGMEPTRTSATVASTSQVTNPSPIPPTTAAAVYDFGDFEPRGTNYSLYRSTLPDSLVDRLGGQTLALLSNAGSGTDRILSLKPIVSNVVPTFIDSAASLSCIRNRRCFVTYTPARSSGQMAAEGHKGTFVIEGYGIAEITVKTEGGSTHRLRFPASHTPSFGMNLLSLPAMDRKGFRGYWGEGRIDIRDPKNGIVIVDGRLAGSRSHGLYLVNVSDNIDSSDTAAPSSQAIDTTFALKTAGRSRSKPCLLSMWHTRFGHADINMIRIMAKRV